MTLGNGVVQGRETLVVGGVEGAPVAQQQGDNGVGANGGGAVDGILAAAVPDTGRGLVFNEEAGHIKVLLGGDKVKGSLPLSVSY